MVESRLLPQWPEDKLARTSEIIGALDSPLRLHIILLLNQQPHVVHELVTELGKSQPLVSQHLRVLKNAGLVSATRTGREMVYRLAVPSVMGIIETIAGLTEEDSRDDLAARRAARQGPDFIDATGSIGSASAVGPMGGHTPDEDPGLIPDGPSPSL
nr:putative transcriptional regulator [Streptococcus thermophilus]